MSLQRLSQLRQWMADQNLWGLIVPRTDDYQGEYVPAEAERLAWATGFTGSAGSLLLLADRAFLFVDGRYTLQAAAEVDGTGIEVVLSSDRSLSSVLATEWTSDLALGFDPWLHSADQAKQLRKLAEKAGAVLTPLSTNPIDSMWQGRPQPPLGAIEIYPLDYAGQSWQDKVAALSQQLTKDKLEAVILTDPSSVAWLLNIRGRDVPYTPLPLGRALVRADGSVEAFFHPYKIPPALAQSFAPLVHFKRPDELEGSLSQLGEAKARVRVDGSQAPAWIVDRLELLGAKLDLGTDPCLTPRACKNAAELAGIKAAHKRDGVALVRFMAWLAANGLSGIDELTVVDRAEQVRAAQTGFQGLSFATIAGFGPNGAIVHYRSTPETNRRLVDGSLLLLDSGGQYWDGTTDVTRTFAIGTPTVEQRRRYTQVLKGNVAVSRALFPDGTTGSQLDVLARHALWADGVDYDHGTGHGVGCFLSVHEGPQRISKAGNSVALKPGMILSNEPGYYKAGDYGIRIENLLAVAERPTPVGGERKLLGFDVLTLAPFDRALIDVSLLTNEERCWIDDYHARVLAEIGPHVQGPDLEWLIGAIKPLF